MLYETGIGKSKIMSSEPVLFLSLSAYNQDSNEIPMAITMFYGPTYRAILEVITYNEIGKSRSEKFKMMASKLDLFTS